MTAPRTAAVQLFAEFMSNLLATEVGDLNIATDLFKDLKFFYNERKYPGWIGGSFLSCLSTFQIMKCDEDLRKDLHAKVVLSDGVAMFQGIGEHMAKECNVSFAKDFFRNSERRSQLGHKVRPAEGKFWIAHRLDTLKRLHSRWLKLRRKMELHFSLAFFFVISLTLFCLSLCLRVLPSSSSFCHPLPSFRLCSPSSPLRHHVFVLSSASVFAHFIQDFSYGYTYVDPILTSFMQCLCHFSHVI